jgi:hypothetical protein
LRTGAVTKGKAEVEFEGKAGVELEDKAEIELVGKPEVEATSVELVFAMISLARKGHISIFLVWPIS